MHNLPHDNQICPRPLEEAALFGLTLLIQNLRKSRSLPPQDYHVQLGHILQPLYEGMLGNPDPEHRDLPHLRLEALQPIVDCSTAI